MHTCAEKKILLGHYDIGVWKMKDNLTHHATLLLKKEYDLWIKEIKTYDLNWERDKSNISLDIFLQLVFFKALPSRSTFNLVDFNK